MSQERRRRIVYLSGTRADFGLVQASLQKSAQTLDVSVLVTGMHLDSRYGHTLKDLQASGLPIFAQIPYDVGMRSRAGMAIGLSECLAGVTKALQENPPDILLLLGDRDEMLAGAIAALHLGIVTVHVHGGERSGTVDEPMRHAISKLCTYHFVATDQSRERLVRMGELAEHVFVVGAPGLDGLVQSANLSFDDCCTALGLPTNAPFVLCLFHPVVQQAEQAYEQTLQVLEATRQLGWPLVWLEPNADAGSAQILRALEEKGLPAGSVRVTHLPRHVFASAMRHCAVMLGNSSAGIIEAASFGTSVVNVGDRQRLRERGGNVLDTDVHATDILAALRVSCEKGHSSCENRYGDGQTAARIADLLARLPISPKLLEKFNAY
jgi:GDP/UDP-N,N'-diacetylbacillosamine 2-epimerase (hydrolysing)